MGGTLFTGMTCSALTAGVMALGSALGQIENSRARVLRMVGTMAVGGDAFADELNAFNPVMNLGHKLATWFQGEFGSTQCRDLTGRDFASTADVREYTATDGTARCERIAQRVAARVADLLERSSKPVNGPAIAAPLLRYLEEGEGSGRARDQRALGCEAGAPADGGPLRRHRRATPLALSLGDRAWAELLERYHELVRSTLAQHRGWLMDTAGAASSPSSTRPRRRHSRRT